MSKAIGYCVLVLSTLISNLYLAAMAGGFSYFAWFAGVTDPDYQRCYAYKKNHDVLTPALSDGPNLHDVTTDFQLINNWGAITFIILFLGYFLMSLTRQVNPLVVFLYFIGLFSWVGLFVTMQCLRFRHMGKVCSGDYLDNKWAASPDPPYMIDQGSFIWWSIISQYYVAAATISGVVALEFAKDASYGY